MKALYIILGVLAFLIIGYVISHVCVNIALFNRFFLRDDPDKIDKLEAKAYDLQRENIFAARKRMENRPFERLTIKSFDGLRLVAKYYEGSTDTLVIMCHGAHAKSLNNFAITAEKLIEKGCGVLIIDQRSSGESEGKYVSYGLNEQYDLLDWIEYTKPMKNVRKIVLYGISMGAATIAFASDKIKDERVRCMIIESGYTSLYELEHSLTSARHLPDFLFSMQHRLTKKRLKADFYASNVDSLAKTAIPALFVWGDDDIVTPLKDFSGMYEKCASEKSLMVIPGAGHAVALVSGDENQQNRFFEFIKKHTGD